MIYSQIVTKKHTKWEKCSFSEVDEIKTIKDVS